MDYQAVPIRWEVVYPAHVEPIGQILLEGDEYRAWLEQEDLGAFTSGDAAVEAVWNRFLE